MLLGLDSKQVKPIRLPEPPSPHFGVGGGVPDIFETGFSGAIRRAVVIGNGFPAAENQCLGLVRALGLADNHLFYVTPSLSLSLSLKLYNCIILL